MPLVVVLKALRDLPKLLLHPLLKFGPPLFKFFDPILEVEDIFFGGTDALPEKRPIQKEVIEVVELFEREEARFRELILARRRYVASDARLQVALRRPVPPARLLAKFDHFLFLFLVSLLFSIRLVLWSTAKRLKLQDVVLFLGKLYFIITFDVIFELFLIIVYQDFLVLLFGEAKQACNDILLLHTVQVVLKVGEVGVHALCKVLQLADLAIRLRLLLNSLVGEFGEVVVILRQLLLHELPQALCVLFLRLLVVVLDQRLQMTLQDDAVSRNQLWDVAPLFGAALDAIELKRIRRLVFLQLFNISQYGIPLHLLGNHSLPQFLLSLSIDFIDFRILLHLGRTSTGVEV